ncbi:MAG: HRDC domain-containing protein, partial [Atopobiaceae bacterium]|nr:HRDC domain-containing protein [Atopobiaceae bacterium]
TQKAELEEKGRLEWVLPEMDAISDETRFVHVPEDAWHRVKKASSLTRRQLGVAREVAAWRELTAQSRNHPRRWVLSDELVVEVAKRTPRSTADLSRIRGTDQIPARAKEGIVAAVARGLACPEDDLPQVKKHIRPSAETEGVVDLMYAVVKLIADENGVAAPLLATRDDLFDMVGGGRSILDGGWRHELLGPKLEALLAGSLGLTVKDGRVEFL